MGRDDRSYDLGYRAHISDDSNSDLPVAFEVAPANEKIHAPDLLDKTVEATKGRARMVVADPQYSRGRLGRRQPGAAWKPSARTRGARGGARVSSGWTGASGLTALSMR